LYPITSGAAAAQITTGGDGNLWFTEIAPSGFGQIGKITPAGQIQEFSLAGEHVISLGGITAGPDGNVWFTAEFAGGGIGSGFDVGKITSSGQVTVFPVAEQNLRSITKADGALWFTEFGSAGGGGIGEFSTTGVYTDHPLTNNSLARQLHGITADSQGDIWCLETVTSGNQTGNLEIGELTPAGKFQENTLISGFGDTLSSGGGLTSGPGGQLYLTENNQIGVVTPSGSGASPTFAQLQNQNAGSLGQYDDDITVGPDGNIWYTQQSFSAIVKLNVTGTSTPTPTPTPTFTPTPTPTFTPTPTPTPTFTPTPTPTTTPTPTPTPSQATSPPHVLGIAGVARSKHGVSSVTVAFDEALNSGSAQSAGFYRVLGGVAKHRKTTFSKKLGLGFLIYDSNANTVRVNLAKPYNGPVQVEVLPGIMAASGAASTGVFTAVAP
jgi:virginiamycin B lyase